MAGEKKIEKPEPVAVGLKSDICAPLFEQEEAARKDEKPSDTTSTLTYSGDATVKRETGPQSIAEQGVYYPPTSCYYYYYPGYNGSYNQLDDNSFTNAGAASYTGFLKNSVSYGSETIPYHSWNSTYTSDATTGTTAVRGRVKSAMGSNVSMNMKGFNKPMKTNNILDSKPSTMPLNTKLQQYNASPNFYKSVLQARTQFDSGYQSAGHVKGFQVAGKFSSYSSPNHGGYFAHASPLNYRPNARMWNSNDRFDLREKTNSQEKFEATTELTRGPRGRNKSIPLTSSAEDEQRGLSIQRDQYNLEDFQTEYDNAKFYIIKSYSEDDIHKCIKYDVWSSTPNGNKKLDAAFQDTVAKTSESGKQCPIFLFYSVNASGQFVGIAEMVGPVDFGKNMNFWQLDKWNGFFPVRWHIIKDIPNAQLRHIILENNDNRPVTYTRDTQEIGLEQGLEMLKIFKSYSGKTSMLDDFNFYEKRGQLLKPKRSSNSDPQTELYRKYDVPKNQKAGERITGGVDTTNNVADPTSSLMKLTKNLLLD